MSTILESQTDPNSGPEHARPPVPSRDAGAANEPDEIEDAFLRSFEIPAGERKENSLGRFRRRQPEEQVIDGTDDESGSGATTTASIRYLLQNRTPYLIRIPHTNQELYGELLVPPLADRVVDGSRLQPFEAQLRPYRQRHEVAVRPYNQERRTAGAFLLVLGLATVIGILGYDFLYHGTIIRWEFLAASVLAVVLFAAVLIRAHDREQQRQKHSRNSDSNEGDIAVGVGGAYADGNEMTRRAVHILVLLLVVTVGAILPSIAILTATDAFDMVEFEGGFEIKEDKISAFTSRVIQMIYVSILSLFPALMYFQFDRQRVGTIWSHWVRSIFRMDSRMRTMADVHARYGDDLIESSNNSAKSVRFLGGNHSPIVIATTLIAIGWTVLVLQTESFDFKSVVELNQQEEAATEAAELAQGSVDDARSADTLEDALTAVAVSDQAVENAESANAEARDASAATDTGGSGGVGTSDDGTTTSPGETGQPSEASAEDSRNESEVTSIEEAIEETQANAEEASRLEATAEGAKDQVLSTDYFQLLVPRPSAAAMAFLGAYFFAVYLVLRSYFRGDLRPKLYNHITARLVTVVVVAYLINVLLVQSEQQALVWSLAFLAGVVPRTIVQAVVMRVSTVVGKTMDESIAAGRPLTQIDGVDLYDKSVLEAEGVTDVPALANSDLATVMMRTRLPFGQLVDWADQAALMVVLNCNGQKLSDEVADHRASGIRTASDYIASCSCAASEVGSNGSVAHDSSDSTSAEEIPTDRPCNECAAMQRQAAWPRIHTWRTSPLAHLDGWIPLPSPPADSPRV